jgi:hypothetical protein
VGYLYGILCPGANDFSVVGTAMITSWRLTRDDFVVYQKYNHVQMHKAISDQNLELLRERLIQTVKLTSDGDNIDRPPMRGMD